jgi:D-sedoheptulose 7-phosphate isomerase
MGTGLKNNSIEEVASVCAEALKLGRKLLFCGNGGSVELANHLATELVCKFDTKRPALDALSLCTNIALITAIANDFGFKHIFSRQLEACAKHGDVLFLISTSGNSENIIEACLCAEQMGVKTVGMCTIQENRLSNLADMLILSTGTTAQIQEHQLVLGHSLVCKIEAMLGYSS